MTPRNKVQSDETIHRAMQDEAEFWAAREQEATSRTSRLLARVLRRYHTGAATYFAEPRGEDVTSISDGERETPDEDRGAR